MKSLIVSIHDVSPATVSETTWWVDQVEALGGLATLLVIPGPWRGRSMSVGDPLAARLREWSDRGHEVSLHGWEHRDPHPTSMSSRILSRGAAEFARLDFLASRMRIRAGLALLAANEVETTGFTPPGWLISREAAAALKDTEIGYFTTHTAIQLVGGRRLGVPVVCHRPGSPLAGIGAKGMRVGFLASRLARRDLRIGLHPDDAHYPELTSVTVDILSNAAKSGTRLVSYRSYLEVAA